MVCKGSFGFGKDVGNMDMTPRFHGYDPKKVENHRIWCSSSGKNRKYMFMTVFWNKEFKNESS